MKRKLELPSLHDHHSHVSLYAALEGQPDLHGLDRGAAMNLLRSSPPDSLGLMTGWRNDVLPLSEEDLKDLPPLIIVNSSLHGFALTPAAAPFIAEIWPEFAERAGDPAWGERNLPLLFAFYGEIAGLDGDKLRRFMDRLERLGVGSTEDMTLTGSVAFRVIASSPYADRIRLWAAPAVYRKLDPDAKKACGGLKIFLDGSLGARSAALDAPFLGGKAGSLIYPDRELYELLAEIAALKMAVSIHAIGHLAIGQALDTLDRLESDGLAFEAPRLEHVQFISRDQARRLRAKGTILSVQPNFNMDSVDYADRLIPRHLSENDPFRMLIDEIGFQPGKDFILGSDGMPHGPACALRWGLFPRFPSQGLDIDEIIKGYGIAQGWQGKGVCIEIDDQLAKADLIDNNTTT